MKKKLIYIVGSVMLTIMLTTIIILSVIQSNYGLLLDNPSKINIYNNSVKATSSFDIENKEYSKILKLYNEMTGKTMLEQVFNKEFLTSTPSEDLTQQAWYELKKTTGIYVEFEYKLPQKLIISRNGNTRRIDIKAIIFRVDSQNSFQKTHVYYRLGDNYETVDSENEIVYPLTIEANTRELFKYISR